MYQKIDYINDHKDVQTSFRLIYNVRTPTQHFHQCTFWKMQIDAKIADFSMRFIIAAYIPNHCLLSLCDFRVLNKSIRKND